MTAGSGIPSGFSIESNSTATFGGQSGSDSGEKQSLNMPKPTGAMAVPCVPSLAASPARRSASAGPIMAAGTILDTKIKMLPKSTKITEENYGPLRSKSKTSSRKSSAQGTPRRGRQGGPEPAGRVAQQVAAWPRACATSAAPCGAGEHCEGSQRQHSSQPAQKEKEDTKPVVLSMAPCGVETPGEVMGVSSFGSKTT